MTLQMYVKHFPETEKHLPWVGVIVNIDESTKTGEVIDANCTKTEEELKVWFASILSTYKYYPECFGVFRSGQSDAENCCSDCLYDKPCYELYRTTRRCDR